MRKFVIITFLLLCSVVCGSATIEIKNSTIIALENLNNSLDKLEYEILNRDSTDNDSRVMRTVQENK